MGRSGVIVLELRVAENRKMMIRVSELMAWGMLVEL